MLLHASLQMETSCSLSRVLYRIFFVRGGGLRLGDFGGVSHRNHGLEIIELQLTNFN